MTEPEWDAEAEALKLRLIELEVTETVEVEDEWTGNPKEVQELVYAGPAPSTVIAALQRAYAAGRASLDGVVEAARAVEGMVRNPSGGHPACCSGRWNAGKRNGCLKSCANYRLRRALRDDAEREKP